MITATARQSELAHFERKLRARSGKLREEIRDTLLRADSEQYASLAGEVHDPEEQSVADLLVDVNLAEITRDVEELRDVEAALDRIHSGTYGTCLRCNDPVDRRRLEAYPTAKRCLPCQQEYDRSRATLPPPTL
jgi:RNA polymerase-binding transcription factor DksA